MKEQYEKEKSLRGVGFLFSFPPKEKINAKEDGGDMEKWEKEW